MRQTSVLNHWFIFAVLAVAIIGANVIAEVLYIDAKNGNDKNPGTKEKPLRTINQAAVIAKGKTEPGPTIIKILPGIYNLTKTVVFRNSCPYTQKDRFIIEASILPDDAVWKPTLMPVVLSIEDPRKPGKLSEHTETYSLKIQVSHVTIRGLKFLGNPLPNNWHACIERSGEDLDDLLVTQCMFIGDNDSFGIYCPIIATGNKLVVDHCIFRNCHASVVFWDGTEGVGSKNNIMRYCIVDGGLISGVWTCQTAEDFEFHHNIITRTEYFWMRKSGDQQTYRLHDCIVTGNRYYSGYGNAGGPTGQTRAEVTYQEKNVLKTGEVMLVKDKRVRHYLHPVTGTLGSNLGAGLFKKPATEIESKPADSGCHTGQLEIKYIGHAAFNITDGKSTLLIDFPYQSGASGHMEYRMEDVKPIKDGLSLVTHGHADHWNQALFEKMDHAVIAPPEILKNVKSGKKISFNDTMTYKDITIQAFKTSHCWPAKILNIQHYSYIVTWHGLQLYIPGDIGSLSHMLTMKNIDVMFIPVWLTGEIKKQELTLDTKTLIVLHQKEAQKVPSSPDYLVLKQGKMIKVGFKEKHK